MKRLVLIGGLFAFAWVLAIGAASVSAQPYPNRPIQLVVPGNAGLMQDLTARIVMEEAGRILGTPIIVLNKPGASMTLGTDFVVRSRKDGYTLLYASSTPLIYAPITNPKTVPYDPLKDVEPLGGQNIFPFTVTVREDAPWKNFGEFIDYAKKNPEKIRIATPGMGSSDNFNIQIVQSLTGAKFTHVPKPSGAAVDLLGGHIEGTFSPIGEVSQYVAAGKLRLLLLSTKLPKYPNVPMITDLGYNQNLIYGWFGLFAPAGIPEEAKKVLIPAVEKAFKTPEVRARIEKLEYLVDYKSPAELKKNWMDEFERAKGIAAKMNLFQKN